MKVLIFDLKTHENDIFDIVSNYLNDIYIYKTNDKNIFLKELKANKYNLLIIDVNTLEGDYIFEEATKINKKYNILVISDKLTYNSGLSCQNCSLNHNRKLLLKPLNAKDLVNYIQNYDKLSCHYSLAISNIFDILEDVLKQFIHYSYNKEESKIQLITDASNTKELISIIDLLNINKIKYVIENDDILIN